MQLELITRDEAFRGLRQAWNQLAGGWPMSSWEWHWHWWQEYGGADRLRLGCVRQGDQVVALAPWHLVRHPVLGQTVQMLGSGKACTDYQRVLLEPDLSAEATDEALGLLASALADGHPASTAVDAFDLDGVIQGEPSLARLTEMMRDRGFAVQTEPLESTWIVELPRQWEAFVGQIHKPFRRKLTKAIRQAQDPAVGFHEALSPEEIAAAWEILVELHQKRFHGRAAGDGCFSEPRFGRFLRSAVLALAERRQARLVWATVENRPIGVQLHLLGPDTSQLYQSGFDPEYAEWEPGHLLYTQVIQGLIAAGTARLDFLRGDEPYKARWSAQARPLARLRWIAPRAASRLRERVYQWGRMLKRTAQARRSGPAAPAPATPTAEPATV